MYRHIVLILVVATTLTAQPVDPFDTVLVTYCLTPQQEAQFSVTDSALSAFWGDWQGRDSLVMSPDSNTHPVHNHWSGDDDCRVVVKAAASATGLYLCFRVVDDFWIDTTRWVGDWWIDFVGFYLDSMPADSVVSFPYDPRMGHISATARAFGARQGGDTVSGFWTGYLHS